MHAPGPVETQTQFFKDQNYKTFFLPKVSQWAMIKYAWSSSPQVRSCHLSDADKIFRDPQMVWIFKKVFSAEI